MGRRRRRVIKVVKKKLPSVFICPRCGEEAVRVQIPHGGGIAKIQCGSCALKDEFQTTSATQQVDVYCWFTDKFYGAAPKERMVSAISVATGPTLSSQKPSEVETTKPELIPERRMEPETVPQGPSEVKEAHREPPPAKSMPKDEEPSTVPDFEFEKGEEESADTEAAEDSAEETETSSEGDESSQGQE